MKTEKIEKFYKNFIKKFISTILLCFVLFGVFTPITHAIYNPRYDFSKTGGQPIIIRFIPPIEYNGIKWTEPLYQQSIGGSIYSTELVVSRLYDKYKESGMIASTLNPFFVYIRPEYLKNNSLIFENKNDYLYDFRNNSMYYPQYVDRLIYDADKKQIILEGGGGNYTSGEIGMYNRVVLYDNIDENAPDFMFFISLQEMFMRNHDGSIRLNTRYLIFRETEVGNGELVTSDDAISLVTSSPVSDYAKSYIKFHNNFNFPLSIDATPLYNFCDTNSRTDHYKDSKYWNLYYECMEGLQPMIMNLYSYVWKDQFGLKVIDGGGNIFEDHGLGDKYETIPPFGNGFKGVEYEKCDTLAIGCHIGNLGKTFYNTIGKFFSNIWNGFSDIIKGIFTWIWDGFLNFPLIKWSVEKFQPMLVILWDYFMSYFTPIWDIFTGKTDLKNIAWGNQEYICNKEPSNFIIENTTPAGKKPMEALGAFLYFINPIPPSEGTELCTGLGMKRIEYGKSTILDVILFNIFVFVGIWFAFIGLRRYN